MTTLMHMLGLGLFELITVLTVALLVAGPENAVLALARSTARIGRGPQ
jgi:hypothetical protein